MSEKIVRIGGASGYWGDSASGPRQLVEKGGIHYLVFDYLAEVTMSILAKMRARSAEAGYATDFITLAMKPLLREIAARKIKVVANAGGVNLAACRAALEQVAAEAGIALKIGTVEGDDLLPRLDELRAMDLPDLATGAPLPDRLLSVNAYLGGFPIAAALAAGADIVVTGRCVDSALVLGPLIHEFGWAPGDYDRLAAGSLAGHLLECGAQATGGNFTDWQDVADGWDDMGYPIAEARDDGSFVVTKPEDTGGLVSPLSLGEQMLYEIGDPRAYVLPDVVCDFTQVRLTQAGKDRVLVSGARGRAPTGTYKVSATYPGGFGCVGSMVVAGFDAAQRARRNGEAILKKSRRMLAAAGLGDFSQTAMQIVGAEALYGANAGPVAGARREVVLRLAIRHPKPDGAELFSREYVGSGLSMSTGRCGLAAGRPTVSPAVRLHSCLIDKRLLDIAVRVAGERVPLPHAAVIGGGDVVPPPAPVADVLPPGRRVEVPLLRLAVARSGDKGNDANIGVMARRAEYLPAIRAALTPEAVKRYFAHFVDGEVERFDLPGTHALNFVLRDSLGGGGTSSLRLDTQAKTYAQLLLSFSVPVPEGWMNELGVSGR
ncbi:MAG: acyclic terpene utilization AtuA family protein [Stellaceae bacterium]